MSRSKQDSGQLTGLKEEIELLKTLIIESHNNVTNLQRAEELTKAEDSHEPLPNGPNLYEPHSFDNAHGNPAPYPPEPPAAPPSGSSSSDSDIEEASPNKRVPSQGQAHYNFLEQCLDTDVKLQRQVQSRSH